MGECTHVSIPFPNRSYQSIVRSDIKRIANTVGFSEHRMGELEIVIAEITSNLVKHATNGGELLVKILTGDEGGGIEIISIDKGPGMKSPLSMMKDGVSTHNTLGHGLGAIQRLSDEFDLYSQKDWGTVLLARLYVSRSDEYKSPRPFEVGVVVVPKTGETDCGDSWGFITKGNQYRLIVADGLGHGPDAQVASRAAVEAFITTSDLPPDEQLREIHTEIKKTRGAVIGVAQIHLGNKQLTYCGVGNISSKIISPTAVRACVSYNGIVGHNIPRTLHNYSLVWENSDILIVHSDGLTTRWDLQKYPGLQKHSASVIAAALYKDHCRGNDDTLVAVLRKRRKP